MIWTVESGHFFLFLFFSYVVGHYCFPGKFAMYPCLIYIILLFQEQK